jgi:hypothetical protein
MYQDISPEPLRDNSVPVGFAAVIPEVIRQIQAAEAAKQSPMPCAWLRNVNTDPPDGSKPGELAALPVPQIDQIEDSSQSITDLPLNRKSLPPAPKSIGAALLSQTFTDLVADAVVEALPSVQQRLLDEGLISKPILSDQRLEAFSEETAPQETIERKIELRLAFYREAKGAPASAYFDRDPSGEFCRFLVIYLNVSNRATCSCLEKGDAGGIQFFAAAAMIRFLSRDPSPLAQTLVAQLKTKLEIAPNSVLSLAAFARLIARSSLLEPIKALSIFGQAFENTIGRSFALAEIDVRIPRKALGKPWDRNPSKRKGTPPHG